MGKIKDSLGEPIVIGIQKNQVDELAFARCFEGRKIVEMRNLPEDEVWVGPALFKQLRGIPSVDVEQLVHPSPQPPGSCL